MRKRKQVKIYLLTCKNINSKAVVVACDKKCAKKMHPAEMHNGRYIAYVKKSLFNESDWAIILPTGEARHFGLGQYPWPDKIDEIFVEEVGNAPRDAKIQVLCWERDDVTKITPLL